MAAQGQLVGFQTTMRARSHIGSVNLRSAIRWLAQRIDAYADYQGSAALYQDLRRLSDAELGARGLRRETLARYAFKLRA
jgi:hypothetical protein